MDKYIDLIKKAEELKRAAHSGKFDVAPDQNLSLAIWTFKASYNFAKSGKTQWILASLCLTFGLGCCFLALQLDSAYIPVRSESSNPYWGPGLLTIFIAIAMLAWRFVIWTMVGKNERYVNEAHAEYLAAEDKAG